MATGQFESCQACEDGAHAKHDARNIIQHGEWMGEDFFCICEATEAPAFYTPDEI